MRGTSSNGVNGNSGRLQATSSEFEVGINDCLKASESLWANVIRMYQAAADLRKLVETARRANEGKDRVRQSQEAAYRFMASMAGDLPGYEEALRALFAGDRTVFDAQVAAWPGDLAAHARKLAWG